MYVVNIEVCMYVVVSMFFIHFAFMVIVCRSPDHRPVANKEKISSKEMHQRNLRLTTCV